MYVNSVHRHQDRPDKAAEFSCNGRDGHVTMLALVKAHELSVQSMLGLEGNGDDGRRLPLTSSLQNELGGSAVAVVPGGLNQESPGVSVAGLGDGTTVFYVAGGML